MKILFFLSFIYLVYTIPSNDQVNLASIPQLNIYANNYTANIWAGYLSATNNTYLYYAFFESQDDPENDPLVLWLNGGPGCSSLAGAFREHGPFIIPVGGSNGEYNFSWNNYSWNTNANVLYIESPASVGFSFYNGTQWPLEFNDTNTTQYNLAALLDFFIKFPNFLENDFYVSGESYAGIYVPYLAYSILQYNESPNLNFKVNLKGIAVGNGCTFYYHDYLQGIPLFFGGHGFIGPNDWNNYTNHDCVNSPTSKICSALSSKIHKNLIGINKYSVYGYCYNYSAYNPELENNTCSDQETLDDFLNILEVQAGLNVINASNGTVTPWYDCAPNFVYHRNHSKGSIWAYPILISAGLRIMFYSGDADGVVPTVGSKLWISELNAQYNYSTIKPTQAWTIPGNNPNETQIAGFWTEYESLRFVQVKGAGHQVPEYKPAEAWKMIYSFLNGDDLD